MLEAVKTTILVVSALFPIVNPLGGSPIFLALTREYTAPARRMLAQQIAVNSFILLIASFSHGNPRAGFFGISLPVVQVGGGLIVISTGWSLLKQKEEDDRGAAHREMDPQDIFRHAFYPLTLPLTVGPGSISVAITLGANAARPLPQNLPDIVGALIGSALIAVSVFLCYGFADRLAGFAGRHGHERDSAVVIVSAALHRRTDFVERRQRLTGVAGQSEKRSYSAAWPDCGMLSEIRRSIGRAQAEIPVATPGVLSGG